MTLGLSSSSGSSSTSVNSVTIVDPTLSSVKQKLSKENSGFLLALLALAVLPGKIFADNKTPEKVEIKGYLIDVSKLAKEAII